MYAGTFVKTGFPYTYVRGFSLYLGLFFNHSRVSKRTTFKSQTVKQSTMQGKGRKALENEDRMWWIFLSVESKYP